VYKRYISLVNRHTGVLLHTSAVTSRYTTSGAGQRLHWLYRL